MLRRKLKKIRLRPQEYGYETYSTVHTLRYNSITRVVELEFSVNDTRAFMRIDNINDIRFRKKHGVVGFIASGKGCDLEFKPAAKTVEVKLGTVFVG